MQARTDDDTEVLPWQQLTRRANRCMALRQYAAARQLYREALWEAEHLMDKAVQHDAPPAPGWDALLAAWVVSHHNMADLLDVLDDVQHAHEHLRQAHEGVMKLLAQGPMPRAAPCRRPCTTHTAPALPCCSSGCGIRASPATRAMRVGLRWRAIYPPNWPRKGRARCQACHRSATEALAPPSSHRSTQPLTACLCRGPLRHAHLACTALCL